MTAPRAARRRDAGDDDVAKIRDDETLSVVDDHGGKEGCCCTDSGERSCNQGIDRRPPAVSLVRKWYERFGKIPE